MKTKMYFIIVFFAYIISSCDVVRVPAKIKNGFSGVYSGQDLSFIESVNFNGYYKMNKTILTKNYRTKSSIKDTFNYYFMFFRDGLFVSFYPYNEKQFNDSLECQNGNSKKCFYSYEWGVFSLSNDTITVIKTHKAASLNQESSISSMKFFIIDMNTLKYLETNIVQESPIANNEAEINGSRSKKYYIAEFHPLKNSPSSDCWLKKKRWFWKDNDAWKQYKRTH